MFSPRRKRRCAGGFSLLEAVIALLILTAGIFGLAMIQLTAVTARNPQAASRNRIATGLAQEKLERMQGIEWKSLGSSPSGGLEEGPHGPSPAFSKFPLAAGDAVTVQGTAYYRVWRVAQDTEIPALKTLSAWCCWKQGDGTWRQVLLVTQRSDAAYR
ncbi:MAG: hypothetical protein HY896_03695 [Deltaproteobacteria bacterium]|nr:hypothetical protein [Deltaproteobacteria bacterium]